MAVEQVTLAALPMLVSPLTDSVSLVEVEQITDTQTAVAVVAAVLVGLVPTVLVVMVVLAVLAKTFLCG
jgi:hypothetical protein